MILETFSGGKPPLDNQNEQRFHSALQEERVDTVSPVDQWRDARATLISYPAGKLTRSDGTAYRYSEGRRLLVNSPSGEDFQVMDTCEAPWAVATVDAAFSSDSIARLDPKYKLKVLERGAGLNIAGTKIIDHLMQRGSGEYHVIELNKDVLHNPNWGTYVWKDWMDQTIKQKSERQGIKYDIDIVIHEGDAHQVTQELAKERKKFNIILSDTFPLKPEEQGLNDIEDVNTLTHILYKEGVFAFFAYYPGIEHAASGSHLAAQQLALLRPLFGNIAASEAEVKPAKGYNYLFDDHGDPIRSLPVVICKDKK